MDQSHKVLSIVAALTVVWLAFVLWRALRFWRTREARAIRRITRSHLDALSKAYRRTAFIDDYGEVNDSKWAKELRYFIKQKFAADIADPQQQKQRIDGLFPIVSEFFLKHAPDLKAAPRTAQVAVDYEAECAEGLRAAGWQTRLTPASGDQGVDIIAEACGCSAVFQCKNHKGAVGNGAVQEIAAGRSFYDATLAGVIAKSGFTAAARQLAQKNDVLLLAPEDLPELRIFRRRQPCDHCSFGYVVEWKARNLKRCLKCGR